MFYLLLYNGSEVQQVFNTSTNEYLKLLFLQDK